MWAQALQTTYNKHLYAYTSEALHFKGTHVMLQGDVIHIATPGVSTVHTPSSQTHTDSITPKPCATLGPLPLHEHCCNPGISKLILCLDASIQATPCRLGLNALLQNAKNASPPM
jgi:hypothetical protein